MQFRNTVLFLVFIPGLMTSLRAQVPTMSDTTHRLSEVIVYSANVNHPATFLDITDSTLKVRSVGQEPSFLLAETPSINAYSDAGGPQGYSYIRMRGIDQTRINMTFDGIPLNEPEDQGAYFSNYPDIMSSVSRLQIQRGIGTSKNGTASYAGSIQLFSAAFTDSLSGNAGIGYGSYNTKHAFCTVNTPLGNKWNFYCRVAEIYSDGYKYHSSNHSQSLVMGVGYHTDNSYWRLNILAGHQQNELAWLGVPDTAIALDPRTNANENERDNFRQTLAQLFNSTALSKRLTLQSSMYYTYLNGSYDFNLNSFLGMPSTSEMYNYAFRSNLFGGFSNLLFSNGRFSATAGVHGNWYERMHTGSLSTFGQLYTNTGYRTESNSFARASYVIGMINVFADLEFRMTTFSYSGSVAMPVQNWTFLNPKGGASVNFNEKLSAYYTAGMTGREPTRNDMFGGNDDLLPDSSGNALLFIVKPESVFDQEAGMRFDATEVHVDCNIYLMNFRNEIVLNGKFGPNGLPLTDDVDKSYRAGIELSALYNLSNGFYVNTNSSYNYARITEGSVTFIPVLTPSIISTNEAGWHKAHLSFALIGRYQDKSFIDYANENSIGGFFLLNTRVTYALKGWSVSAYLNNITGTKYYSNGYVDYDGTLKYFVQMPFNYHFALSYSW